jgi:phage gp46-like protein
MRDFNLIDTLTGTELTFGSTGQQVYLLDPVGLVFSRSTAAYNRAGVQIAANLPRYENALHGMGLMIESATDNYLLNPLDLSAAAWESVDGCTVELQSGAWWQITDATAGATAGWRQKVAWNDYVYSETVSMEILKTSGGVSASVAISFCAYGGTSIENTVVINTDTGAVLAGTSVSVSPTSDGNAWHVAITNQDNNSGNTELWLTIYPAYSLNGSAIADPLVTGSATVRYPQLEPKAYATSFIDGSRTADVAYLEDWHTSDRHVFNQISGTFECWVAPNSRAINPLNSSEMQNVLGKYASSTRYFYLAIDPTINRWVVYCATGSYVEIIGPEPTYQAQHVAITWEGETITLYIDGVACGSIVTALEWNDFYRMGIGCVKTAAGNSNYNQFNGLIWAMRISERALPPTQFLYVPPYCLGNTPEAYQFMFSFNGNLLSDVNPSPVSVGDTPMAGHWEIDQSTVLADRSDGSILNNIHLSMAVERGSWWFNPDFGLRSLARMKNTDKAARLVREYIKEALQWLLDTGRATNIDITVTRDSSVVTGRVLAHIVATQADGRTVNFSKYIEVV